MIITVNRRTVLAGLGTALGMAAFGTRARAADYIETSVEGGGRIAGRLTFSGEPPPEDHISISKDGHICGSGDVTPNPLQLGPESELLNGVVALRDVAEGKPWDPTLAAPRVVQADCRFRPFVQIAPNGAELTILNEDPLLHNIHTYEQIGRARRTLFNIAQPAAGQADTATLNLRRGWVVEIDCDAHNWMSAWIYTASHPYLTVTGEDGRFDIGDVPPGIYELVMWHPVLGERSREITIGSAESTELSLDMTL